MFRILALNPGSTSTKLGVYEDAREKISDTLRHTSRELAEFPDIPAQGPFRRKIIAEFLAGAGISADSFDAVIGRGGLLKPVESGVFRVNRVMLTDLETGRYGNHASNLGGILAAEIAERAGCPAFIADPVVVDEMHELARLSGFRGIKRRSVFHALNQKAAARKAASTLGKPYKDCRLIVAHLGGGITVGSHAGGRVIDVNNGLDGDGPMAAERSGTVPAGQLVSFVLDAGDDGLEARKRITGGGGLAGYCGTNDLREIISRMNGGDREAGLTFRTMAYQIAKEISMHGAVLKGSVDRIIITGGMAFEERLTSEISERVAWIAPVDIIPGEEELSALAENALEALRGNREVKEYR
jgi:butyrate kinase